MQRAGADSLDIGAESTRPGSAGITAVEELRRLLAGPASAAAANSKSPSRSTRAKPAVAEIAIGAGAAIINDVSGLKNDPRIAEVAARHRVSR